MRTKTIVLLVLSFSLFFLGCTRMMHHPESGETMTHWTMARDFQAQERYELAKQYYTMALASARTVEAQEALRRELDAIGRTQQAIR